MAAMRVASDARAVNSTVVQLCVIETSDDIELEEAEIEVDEVGNKVDGAETELSPSSPEAMMRDVANDPTANIEYGHQVPWAFSQPHVEAAFQAQYTEIRLMFAACVVLGSFVSMFGRLMFGLLPAIFPDETWSFPVGIPIGACVMFLLVFLGLLCNRAKLREYHHVVQALSNLSFFLLFATSSSLTLTANVYNGGFENPFAAAYASGLILAGGTCAMAHTEASLCTFLFNAVNAVAVCMTPGAGMSPVVATVASAFVLGSISQQIMLQHRHSFTAQVRQQLWGMLFILSDIVPFVAGEES